MIRALQSTRKIGSRPHAVGFVGFAGVLFLLDAGPAGRDVADLELGGAGAASLYGRGVWSTNRPGRYCLWVSDLLDDRRCAWGNAAGFEGVGSAGRGAWRVGGGVQSSDAAGWGAAGVPVAAGELYHELEADGQCVHRGGCQVCALYSGGPAAFDDQGGGQGSEAGCAADHFSGGDADGRRAGQSVQARRDADREEGGCADPDGVH